MSRHGEALAQLERLMAVGLLHHFGDRMSANEAHAAMGDVVPKAIAAMSDLEREAFADLLQRTVNASMGRKLRDAPI